MTDKERIDRLEEVVRRLCFMLVVPFDEPKSQPMIIDPSRWQEEGDERV